MDALLVDLVTLALLTVMTVAGYQRGALTSIMAIALAGGGAVVGATIGAAAGGRLVAIGALFGGLVAAAIFATQLDRATAVVEDLLGDDGLGRMVDRVGGMLIGGAFALVVVWVVGVVLTNAQTRNHSSEAVRDSKVLGALFGIASPTGSLAADVARSGLVPALDGPVIITDDPDASVTSLPVVANARASVVRVVGRSCDVIATGTAWPISTNLLVTNAHVVAGERATSIQLHGEGPATPVSVVGFDALDDVAFLSSSQLHLTPLPIQAVTPHGQSGAIIGYPRQRGLQVNPARFDRVVNFPTKDIYNRQSATIPVAVFRGAVEPGNSGSPMVSADGRVMMMVAADAIGQSAIGGFGVPVAVIEREAGKVGVRPVSTGPCIDD